MKGLAITLATVVVGSLVLSSCSGGPEGVPISSATLSSYRTPPGAGILCGGPGQYDFLTFTITKGIVSGHIVETNVSTRAELPMNGSGNGNTITLLPLSGFGEFQGSLHNHSLDLSMVNMSGPGAIQCSVTSRAQWKTIAAHTKGFTSRQLSTPEFLAMDDLIIAGSLTEGISSGADGPFANQVALANALSAQQGRFINPNARDGYTVGAAAPEPVLSFTTGPVSRRNDVSVFITPGGFRPSFASRAADGSCWYVESENVSLSTAPGVVESTCSAGSPVGGLVKYEGP